jgi:hypothetical protein
MLNFAESEMAAIERDPFGFIAGLASAFCDLLADNHQLRERIAVLEAASRVTRRDEEQPADQQPLPQLH